MKRFFAYMMAAAFILWPTFSAGAGFQKTKIAVLDFEMQGEGFETRDMGAIVAEWLITAFVKEGRFDVVERSLLNQIIEEQKLGRSGMVDESTATKIGELLGVKAIISGSLSKLRDALEINARIIDVESASIIAAESVKSAATGQLHELVGRMVQKITKNFPLEGYVVGRDGRVAAIDLGGRAGVKPGMQFIVYKEGDVVRHPKTGEILDIIQIETGRLKITSVRSKLSEGEIITEISPGAVSYGQQVSSTMEPPAAIIAPVGPAKGRLFVNPVPSNAWVRILNIDPDYRRGMELDPGRYLVEATAVGWSRKIQWVEVKAGQDLRLPLPLEKIRTPASTPPRKAPSNETAASSPGPSSPASRPSPLTASLSPEMRQYLDMLQSGDSNQMIKAAKKIVRYHPTNAALLETARKELLKGYRHKQDDRRHVDAMAWLCNMLGASGRAEYISILDTVARKTPSLKLHKYAVKNKKKLEK
ncbi:MAG: hypothetical protein GY859_26245 [Desulfobacterales bacterium]|nr:hypothetical protein [Desulfobacterales bacterium]